MTHADLNRSAPLAARLRARLALRRTAAELRTLSDASLEDIGMNRADIETMVGR